MLTGSVIGFLLCSIAAARDRAARKVRDQHSLVLKAITRTGLLYWPSSKSATTVSRRVDSTSVSRHACPIRPPKSSSTRATRGPARLALFPRPAQSEVQLLFLLLPTGVLGLRALFHGGELGLNGACLDVMQAFYFIALVRAGLLPGSSCSRSSSCRLTRGRLRSHATKRSIAASPLDTIGVSR